MHPSFPVRGARALLASTAVVVALASSLVSAAEAAAPLNTRLPERFVRGEAQTAAASDGAEPATLGADLAILLELARTQSPEYAAMLLDADAAAERVGPAGALPDPKFRVELRDLTRMGEQRASLDPTRVGSTRYLLMQDLPWYGKRELRKDIAALEAEGAKGAAHGALAELVARIKTVHVQRYYLQENTRLTQELIDIMARLERVAQSRYAAGLAAQPEVIRAQIEQTGLRNELLALAAEDRRLQVRLNALISRPGNAPLAAPSAPGSLPPPVQLQYATLETRLRNSNPQLFADDARVRAAEKNRDLVLRNRYPDITVGVSPIQYGKAVREWELMLEMNIPLQQDTRRAQERESERMLSAATARREATRNRLLGELGESLANIELALQSERLATGSLLPQAEITFQSALAGYENGKVDFATLLDAQRQIRQARLGQYKAQAEARMAIIEVEKLLGEAL